MTLAFAETLDWEHIWHCVRSLCLPKPGAKLLYLSGIRIVRVCLRVYHAARMQPGIDYKYRYHVDPPSAQAPSCST